MRSDTITERYGPQPVRRAVESAAGKLRFGAVTVAAQTLTEHSRRQAVSHSQSVLAAAAEWLLGKQGMDAGVPDALPKYALEPNDPATLIRHCAGETRRGRIDQGAFQVQA